MENAPEKLSTYAVGAVDGEPTTFQRSDAPPAVTAKRQPLENTHGKLKTLTEKEHVKC